MKIVQITHETSNEVSIYVSSKEQPTRTWAIAHSPYQGREIDTIQIHPRSLKRDILDVWPLHLVVNILFLGLPLLGYAGFWAYERCVPLWDVRIRYTHPSDLTATNPLFTVGSLVAHS